MYLTKVNVNAGDDDDDDDLFDKNWVRLDFNFLFESFFLS